MSLLIIGGTSGLGEYLLHSFRNKYKIIINLSKYKTDNRYDYNYTGDINNKYFLKKIFNKHNIHLVIISVKPKLLGTSIKEFLNVNYYGILNVLELSKMNYVKRLIYVSSIACANHYKNNIMVSENVNQPIMSEYKSPYDMTKRLGEKLVLSYNSENFKTISIRIASLISNKNDTYTEYFNTPIMFGFKNHKPIDVNYSGNVSEAILEIDNRIKQENTTNICGKFYYYTGFHYSPSDIAEYISLKTNKSFISFPSVMLNIFRKLKKNEKKITLETILTYSAYEQTFNNKLFYKTFNFNEKYTLFEGIDKIYN